MFFLFSFVFLISYLFNNFKFKTMKRIILTLALAVSLMGALNAQVDKKAIGLRLGNGAEISYQHPLGNANRLELDLGLNGWGYGLDGIYQWVWGLPQIAQGVNWYAGVGAGLGINPVGFGLGVLGQVGAEYSFNFPLQLSLDYRPGIYFLPAFGISYSEICLGVRYRF
jgi:hypothetical protein